VSGCRMPPDDEMLGLPEDVERLADIGDLILAGASIGEFGLTENERHFVTGYVRGRLARNRPSRERAARELLARPPPP
jgi:hypothetical protein